MLILETRKSTNYFSLSSTVPRKKKETLWNSRQSTAESISGDLYNSLCHLHIHSVNWHSYGGYEKKYDTSSVIDADNSIASHD
jgi:hypothetical protein